MKKVLGKNFLEKFFMILVLGLWSAVTVSMHAGVCFAQGSVTVQNASGGFVGSYSIPLPIRF